MVIGSCRDILERVKPPRSLFVNFPLGRPCGQPNDVKLQSRIIKDALSLFEKMAVAGKITDFQDKWPEPFDWKSHERELEKMLREEGWTVPDWKPKMK